MDNRETVAAAYRRFVPERKQSDREEQIDLLACLAAEEPVGVVDLANAAGLAHHRVEEILKMLVELGVVEPASGGATLTDSFREALHEIEQEFGRSDETGHRVSETDDTDEEGDLPSDDDRSENQSLSAELSATRDRIMAGNEASLRRSYDPTIDDLITLAEIAIEASDETGTIEREARELLQAAAEAVSREQAEELSERASEEFTRATLYATGTVLYQTTYEPSMLVTDVDDLVDILVNNRAERRVVQAVAMVIAAIARHGPEHLTGYVGELTDKLRAEVNRGSTVSIDFALFNAIGAVASELPEVFNPPTVRSIITVAERADSESYRRQSVRILRDIAVADPGAVRGYLGGLDPVVNAAGSTGDEKTLTELCRLCLTVGGSTAEDLMHRITTASESPDIVAEATKSWSPPDGVAAEFDAGGSESVADEETARASNSSSEANTRDSSDESPAGEHDGMPVRIDVERDPVGRSTEDLPVPDVSAVASPPRQNIDRNDLQLRETIDHGGQATVHLATLPEGDEQIALREPLGDRSIDRSTVETFLNRADVWATVDDRERRFDYFAQSEHVVGVIDTGDHLPWIATEYMDGKNLDGLLNKHPDGLPIEQALWIGECICKGAEVAHKTGIAHLDIKPENVLLTETDGWPWPKVADWGLARRLAAETGTTDGVSVDYAAPEQLDREAFGEPDTLSDVYGIGATIYELLTGSPPYTGSPLEVIQAATTAEVPDPPSSIRPDVTRVVDRVVSRALRAEKTDRYDGIAAFSQALKGARTGGPLPPSVTAGSGRSTAARKDDR